MAMLALLAIPALVLYLARCFRVYLRNSEQYVRPQCFCTHDMKPFLQSRIPAVGSDNLLYSFWTAVRCIYESPVVFEEGYRRYKGRVFRVPQLTGWLVLVSGDKLIEELRKVPEHLVSADQAHSENLQAPYTLGPSVCESTYHVGVVRHSVNKNLAALLPLVVDEIVAAFPEELESKLSPDSEWTSLRTKDVFLRIVSRVVNRTLVGLPVCRVDEYIKASIRYAYIIMTGASVIKLFPDILKPFVGSLVARMTGPQHTAFKHLAPIIQERKASRAEYGCDYPGRPNDILSWIIDAAPLGQHSSTKELSLRTLVMNFSALHTTSLSLTHAMYNLASYPEYAEPLRQEVVDCLGLDTTLWTKEAMEKCCKLDSFLKEGQRMNPLSAISLSRRVMQDFTFSDGTVVPAGALLCAPQKAVHRDQESYEDPGTFDGFRFWRIREKMRDERQGENGEDDEEWRNRLTGTGIGFLTFGGGRHVCPGRFFASLELKCIMAYMLISYDVKMRKEGKRPDDVCFGVFSAPDPKAEVMFRRRA